MKNYILCDAIKKIALGYLLLHLNINSGSVDLLPGWAGYLLMLYALPNLGKEEESAKLLIPLCKVLMVISVYSWLNISFFSGILEVEVITMLTTIISLYFDFQLFTNLATIAARYGCSQEKGILRLRTVNTLLGTIFAVATEFYEIAVMEYILFGMAIVWAIVSFWILALLCSLKNELYSVFEADKEVKV